MGGDHAPENVVAGAIEALRETHNRFEILFVGSEHAVKKELTRYQQNGLSYHIIDAPQVIDMHDAAIAAVKHKKDSSINIGVTLHKEGKADAFVSAGHSGAVMSTSTVILGRVEGVGRPTIGAFFPSEKGIILILDAGANVDCKPRHLYEFGVMGSIYINKMLGVENPSIGLLNIGEESSKGNDVAIEAYKLLKESKLNFVGNLEGRDILKGKAHVVVCDGFVGNIVIKFAESVPAFFKDRLREYFKKNLWMQFIGLSMTKTLRSAFRSLDYEEHGGVPVLGVNGVSIIGHGKSTPKAIKNMILRAEEMVQKKIHYHIKEALASSK